jgi:hypothetical protein
MKNAETMMKMESRWPLVASERVRWARMVF